MTFRARDKSIRLLLDVRQLQVQLAFQSIVAVWRGKEKVMVFLCMLGVQYKYKFMYLRCQYDTRYCKID